MGDWHDKLTENDLSVLLLRLRDADALHRVTHRSEGSLWGDAADAIEALHGEVAALRAPAHECQGCVKWGKDHLHIAPHDPPPLPERMRPHAPTRRD